MEAMSDSRIHLVPAQQTTEQSERNGSPTSVLPGHFSAADVAAARWQAVMTRNEALLALQEIVGNAMGSEDFAVFLCEGNVLKPLAYCGSSFPPVRDIPIEEGITGYVARTGEYFFQGRGSTVRPADTSETLLTACIPLRLDTAIFGVLAIYRLLPQKQQLSSADEEVLHFLEINAAAALWRGNED
jgi:hypothetical protein